MRGAASTLVLISAPCILGLGDDATWASLGFLLFFLTVFLHSIPAAPKRECIVHIAMGQAQFAFQTSRTRVFQ